MSAKYHVYRGQTALRIKATCGQDITDAQAKQIKYIKPDGTTGAWNGEVEDAETGAIYYDIKEETEMDPIGTMRCWDYIKFKDGRDANGDTFEIDIHESGTVI